MNKLKEHAAGYLRYLRWKQAGELLANIKAQNQGFTLVELSIVLVIIGLIVGGVVGGQSLMESARISNVVKEFGANKAMLNAFELQYDALPGDFAEATDYWPDEGTLSGDGDGSITGYPEIPTQWEHLFFAGISPYALNESGCGPSPNIGCNTLEASIKGAGYLLVDGPDDGLVWRLGADKIADGTERTRLRGGALTAVQAKAIDKKIDDGKPNNGDLEARTPIDFDTEVEGLCYSSGGYVLGGVQKRCYLELRTY
jgi:prepilin-type N-terminal cleavage/methylation domain-containing protein